MYHIKKIGLDEFHCSVAVLRIQTKHLKTLVHIMQAYYYKWRKSHTFYLLFFKKMCKMNVFMEMMLKELRQKFLKIF